MSEVEFHNIEAEQAILGALLLNNDLIDNGGLSKEIFFDPVHARIFEEIQIKVETGNLASPITIKTVLQDNTLNDVGGAKYLATLASSSLGPSSFPQYLKLVIELYGRRRAQDALTEALEKLNTFDPDLTSDAILSEAEAVLTEVVVDTSSKPLIKSFLMAITEAITEANSSYQNAEVPGVSTGVKQLDDTIGKLGESELIILAARPSMGKSAIAFNASIKAAKSGLGVFFASLEMPSKQLAHRFFSQELAEQGHNIPYRNIRNGWLSEDEFRLVIKCGKEFEGLPIYTAEPDCKKIDRLRSAIRRAKKVLPSLDLIVVDYLQLIDASRGNYKMSTFDKISNASNELKAIANEYKVPVLALSQLNRSVELRDPPVPVLSDLRGSGDIEQDADVVIFVYRAEYYIQKKIDALQGSENMDDRATLESQLFFQKNKVDLIVAKQRNGATGNVKAYLNVKYNDLRDLNDAPKEEEF